MRAVVIAIVCAAAAAAQDYSASGITMYQSRARPGRESANYQAGTRALDARRYDEAIREFEAVIAAKSDRADGALYWEAYALNRSGRREQALAAIDRLRKAYATSSWLSDAQALEVEIRQSAGQPVSPADETNEDLKLMAINSLMGADPERAVPLLEGLLKGNAAPKVKDRAMFVLTQNRSPRAQQILMDYAKGGGNPDLRLRAIRYIGMSGTAAAQQQLVTIYGTSTDAGVKREILRALTASQGRDQIFTIAKNEKDDEVRTEAIRQLGAMRATEQIAQLEAGSSPEVRVEIVRALFAAGAAERLAEIAKSDKDARVRTEAIRQLGVSRQTSVDSLAALYAGETEPRVKQEIVRAFQMRGDAKGLVDLARKESDPALKRQIVSQLANMRNSKEATDYMMELLK